MACVGVCMCDHTPLTARPGLCVATLTGGAKIKEKLTCGRKNDIRNLVNFHVSSQKSKNLHFDWLLLSNTYKDLDDKILKSYVS